MVNEYLGLNIYTSQSIYRDLVAGKIINDYEVIDGEFQQSIKYRELVDNIDKYRYMYSLLGFEIKSINSQAYFATRQDRGEEYNEVAANIQILLLIICRGVYALGISPAIMLDPTAGIGAKHIDEIGQMEEQERIIKACGLRQPLTESVNGQLVNRGICFRTKDDRYVLSSAGKHLFNEISTSSSLELAKDDF